MRFYLDTLHYNIKTPDYLYIHRNAYRIRGNIDRGKLSSILVANMDLIGQFVNTVSGRGLDKWGVRKVQLLMDLIVLVKILCFFSSQNVIFIF